MQEPPLAGHAGDVSGSPQLLPEWQGPAVGSMGSLGGMLGVSPLAKGTLGTSPFSKSPFSRSVDMGDGCTQLMLDGG